jgi:rRNA maturation protein Nop10
LSTELERQINRERQRKWRAAYPEKAEETYLNYRNANRARIKETISRWEDAHPESAKERMRKYRKTHHDSPEKRSAQILAKKTISLKEKCQNCGKRAAVRHHPDYSRPLEVMHLCKTCHSAIHRLIAKGV